MKLLGRLWRGELPLDDAFWTWAVIGGLIVNGLSSAGFVTLIMAEQQIAALIVGYAVSIPYNVIVAVGVWRSAEHHEGDRRWAETARIGTAVGMIVLSVT